MKKIKPLEKTEAGIQHMKDIILHSYQKFPKEQINVMVNKCYEEISKEEIKREEGLGESGYYKLYSNNKFRYTQDFVIIQNTVESFMKGLK